MTETKTHQPIGNRAVVLPLRFLMETGKRLGLGKQIAQLGMKLLRSRMQVVTALADYHPTEHDVFVATFGKSGTNWMMQIAQQIAHGGEAEFEHIHDVVAWPEAPGSGSVPLDDARPAETSPAGLRVIKTHLPTTQVPYSEKSTYLTVLRDPKEVLVSSYYFIGGLLGVLGHVTIDDWFDISVAPGRLMDSWAVHTAGFWNWRDRSNVLVLNFSEIKSQPRRSIERVAAIMGVELTEVQLAKVIERASFEYMSAHEPQFSPPASPLAARTERIRMVRRGKSGESDELLSQDRQMAIDLFCQGALRRIGSDFPYAAEFDAGDSSNQ